MVPSLAPVAARRKRPAIWCRSASTRAHSTGQEATFRSLWTRAAPLGLHVGADSTIGAIGVAVTAYLAADRAPDTRPRSARLSRPAFIPVDIWLFTDECG